MKTCLFLISLDSIFKKNQMSLFDAVDIAASLGFDAVEPYPVLEFEHPDLQYAKKFKAYCDEKGLAIPCFSMGIRLETEDYLENVERLKKYVGVACVLGAGYLHHTLIPTLQRDGISMPYIDDVLPRITEACRMVAGYAQEKNVHSVYEEQGYVINGTADFGRFVKRLKNYGIVLDTGNILFADETIQGFAGRYANDIRHVHVKDYLIKMGNSQFPGSGWYLSRGGNYLRGTVVGHGTVDFVQTFKILLQAGYDGYYSIEFDGMEDAREAVSAGLNNMRYYYDEAQKQCRIFKAKELV